MEMALSSSNDEEKRREAVGSCSPALTNIVAVEAADGMAEGAGIGCPNEECEGGLDMGSKWEGIFSCIYM
jgi:hypothetical protein